MFDTAKAKDLKKDGLLLKNIPENERTARLCKIAIKQNPMAIKYVPSAYLNYKICLEAVRQNRYVLKYVPSQFVDRKMCELVVRDNESLLFTGKRYSLEEKLFFVTFKVVDNQRTNSVLCEGATEFHNFDNFYKFLNGDLANAELRDYDFEKIHLKNLLIY